MPSTNTAARARTTAELLKDAVRGDYVIATVTGGSQCLVGIVRREMEAQGLIAPAPPAQRAQLPKRPAVRPYSPELPRQPDFSRGRCTSPGVDPNWWTSHDQREREAAIWACRGCPVLVQCRQWSLSLPVADTTIYGAWTASERARAKRERAAAVA